MDETDRIQHREDLKQRLKVFVIELINVANLLPDNQEIRIIKGQFLRSGSSVYANYRAACRARSKADFFSKISIVVEEADETEMWLDLLLSLNRSFTERLTKLHDESIEILKIMSSARKNIYK